MLAGQRRCLLAAREPGAAVPADWRATALAVDGRPNETTVQFLPNGDMMAMVRRICFSPCSICSALGIWPPMPGNFSAFGLRQRYGLACDELLASALPVSVIEGDLAVSVPPQEEILRHITTDRTAAVRRSTS